MLWSKKKPNLEPEAAPTDAAVAGGPDALDVLLTLLRIYGKHGFDTDEVDARDLEARCDDWATHLSMGTASPSGAATARRGGRDWPGLVAFMQAQRQAEGAYVVRSLRHFREAVLCFAAWLNASIGEERASDAALAERLEQLSRAVTRNDTATIRAEAVEVVSMVRRATEQRRKREAEQVWELGQSLRELREELVATRQRAEVDALTQLPNRAAFDVHLQHITSIGQLLGEPPWLLMVDLDRFKAINDTYGHVTGDEVLRQVSHCLNRTFLRRQDFVCRYGGEEFAALLLDTTQAQMRLLVQRLRENVRALAIAHGAGEIGVTVSVGMSALAPGDTPARWIRRSDAALYRAKSAGRDRAVEGSADGTER